MSKSARLQIQTDSSIIGARADIRALAQSVGLSTVDQARISLATSSLAYALGLGPLCRAQLVVSCLNSGERAGVRVVCTTEGNKSPLSSIPLSDARLMADALSVEELPSGEIQITVTQWAK